MSAAKTGSDASHPAVHLPFYEAAELTTARVGFCSAGVLSDSQKRALAWIRPRALEQLLYQGLIHFRMAWDARSLGRTDVLVVLEFNPLYMGLAAPLLRMRRGKVLLVLHGAQQFAMVSLLHLLGLWYTRLFGLGFIQFEIDQAVPPRIVRIPKSRCVVVPHPLDGRCRPRLEPGERIAPNQKLKIGMAGMFRKGKPFLDVAIQVKALLEGEHPDCELVLGTPSWQDDGRLAELGLSVSDTSTSESYIEFLRSVDITVHHFDADLYFYRPSGTIADAIACGCHPVCPDFPLFRNQILSPVPVGTVFESIAELPRAIGEAVAWVREHGQDGQWVHRESRSPQLLADILDAHASGTTPEFSAWTPLPANQAPTAPRFRCRFFMGGY